MWGTPRLPARPQAHQSTIPNDTSPLWYKGHPNSHSLGTCVPGTVLDAENLKVTETATSLDLYEDEVLKNGGGETLSRMRDLSMGKGKGQERREWGVGRTPQRSERV